MMEEIDEPSIIVEENNSPSSKKLGLFFNFGLSVELKNVINDFNII